MATKPRSRTPRAAAKPAAAALPSPTTTALAAGTLGLVALAAPTAHAATFTVSNLNDSGAGSLRDAVATANVTAGPDVINFQPGLTGVITLTSGQLEVTDSVDIQGPGASSLSVSGNDSSRVFYLYSGAALLNVSISNLTITNGASSIGAGIANFNENLDLDGMVITNNAASDDGGGLWMDGFDFRFDIQNSTITGNTAQSKGGGVYVEDTNINAVPNLIRNTVISGNTAARGGGIYLYDPDSQITIDQVTISDNEASVSGGGMTLQDTDAGDFIITNSTFSGNQAPVGGGAYFYQPDTPLLISNTTVSGNQGTTGAGIYFYDGFDADLSFVTVVSNVATGDGGGLFVLNNGPSITNSIVADNSAAVDSDLGGDDNFDVTYSLIEVPGMMNDNGNNITGVDPQLGPLADNGGPTETHLPSATSPALDAANLALTPGITSDQRGNTRPGGAAADMGAVELNGGTFVFDPTTYTVDENDGTVSLTVTRTGGTDPASVNYTTNDGTANAGSDYTASSGTINFAAGQTSQSVVVGILDDAATEPPETFTVSLTNPVGGTIGTSNTATVTINDVENGSIQFSSATYTVSEDGGSLTVTVVRTGGATGTVSANYSTSNGSATAGADYTTTTGTVTFVDGDTSETFVVPILPDAIVEGDETFNLTLTAPTGGATIGSPATAVATIVDAPAEAVAAIPIFDGVGRFFALIGTALVGLFMITRKRLFGFFLAMLFLGMSAQSMSAAESTAATTRMAEVTAQHQRPREVKDERVRGVIASITRSSAGSVLTFQDGTAITLPSAKTTIRDARRGAKKNAAVTALRAGQTVIVRNTKNGTIVKVLP